MSVHPTHWPYRSALVIVAHPDDEILWAGGTILMHPETDWTLVALCRGNDPDRAPKFRKVLALLGAKGCLGDLDDGPDQTPLATAKVEAAVLALTGCADTDLILTHSSAGEYTRHRRHEELGSSVIALWKADHLRSPELWTFAYTDEGGTAPIHAVAAADLFTALPSDIWSRKQRLISEVYGFAADSFEMRAALQEEAFWKMTMGAM